eukprot:5540431-Amphidinium_carterae.1
MLAIPSNFPTIAQFSPSEGWSQAFSVGAFRMEEHPLKTQLALVDCPPDLWMWTLRVLDLTKAKKARKWTLAIPGVPYPELPKQETENTQQKTSMGGYTV